MAGTPRVWIADLAAYNAGHLHGEWVDATDLDEMREVGERLIKTSPVWKMGMNAEELAIHDYDGFGDLASRLGEYPSWESVANVATLFLDAIEGVELESVTEEDFHEHYRGEWDSEEAYAEYEVNELGWAGVPAQVNVGGMWATDKSINVFEELSSYLDWESIARELFQHGTLTSRPSPDYKIYVFEQEV